MLLGTNGASSWLAASSTHIPGSFFGSKFASQHCKQYCPISKVMPSVFEGGAIVFICSFSKEAGYLSLSLLFKCFGFKEWLLS